MPRFRRLQYKFLLVTLVVSLVPLGVLGIYGYTRISASLERSAVEDIRWRLERARLEMENALDQGTSDVLFLSRLPDTRLLAEGREGERSADRKVARHDLALVFAAFVRAKRFYHQIRYIDQAGREVVRVDYDEGAARVVPEEDLQDKSGRYYFREAMRLREGEVYVSPLDLNRERGEVEVPHRPTIRYATPVFSGDGERRGIVVTNLHAARFLDRACSTLGTKGGVCFAADEEGYYTMHADPRKTWGGSRDLGTGEGLRRDFPRLWRDLIAGRKSEAPLGGRLLFVSRVRVPSSGAERRWLLGKVYSRSDVLAPLREFRPFFFAFAGGALALSTVLAVYLARRVSAPLKSLQTGARRIGAGDLDHRIPVTTSDEIGALARDFNGMADRLKDYVADLQKATAARERAESELRVAAGIQRMMLPRRPPAATAGAPLGVAARYRPARQVGGDFYNHFFLDSHRLALVLGDVSGKGVPAALVMAMTQALVRTYAAEAHSPAEILRSANRMLISHTQSNVFVTAFLGICDARTGRLVWANAGHPHPFLLEASDAPRELAGSDLILGVADEERFSIEDRSVLLAPGDRVVIFSDGFPDSVGPEDRFFGLDGLKECLAAHRGEPLDEMCEAAIAAVLRHQGSREQADDLTILALEVRRLEAGDPARGGEGGEAGIG